MIPWGGENSFISNRPLTTDDIAQRRELLRQKQAEQTATTAESTGASGENVPTTSENGAESNENNDENVFLAFARIFSGRLKQGQKIFVLSPRHDPSLFDGKVNSPILIPTSESRLFFRI